MTMLALGLAACRGGMLADACWDLRDVDPLCGGTICSMPCADDVECQNAAAAAGSSSPSGARCGSGGECDFVSTGLGAFFCA